MAAPTGVSRGEHRSIDASRVVSRVTAPANARTLESLSLAAAATAFVLAAVIALPVFGYAAAPIDGPGSAGQYAAAIAEDAAAGSLQGASE